ncbi:hypothetical protein [Blastococcus sp. TF02A-26]|uniref:hypothetical protein n=1 Tax=Blastococcus sp. TF02A-26 TaxID=2250577 RepID=UPI000DEB31D2|nr:hypothetical protein [Blastococcus sp. TF02A-26]RBY82668.1 hypothetical protein DQ240_18395 [Blastococcus sp. TF02A-26]
MTAAKRLKWVAFPLNISDDPRMLAAGEPAEVLWTRAWTWCGKYALDGRIPKGIVARLAPDDTAARVEALLEEELWVDEGDCYLVADWEEVIGSVKGLNAQQKAAADRSKKYRQNVKAKAERLAVEAGQTSLLVPASRDASRDAAATAAPSLTVVPDPADTNDGDAEPGEALTCTDPASRDASRHASRDASRPESRPRRRRRTTTPLPPLASEGGTDPAPSSTSPPAAARPSAGCDPVAQPHAGCRGCGTNTRAGRRAAAAAAAVTAEQERIRAERERAAAAQAERQRAVDACEACDTAGYLSTGQPCDHVRTPGAAERGARGVAKCRAELAARTRPPAVSA